eukprot:scaffold14098_cov129-Isochrysis_galbana.AAC.6
MPMPSGGCRGPAEMRMRCGSRELLAVVVAAIGIGGAVTQYAVAEPSHCILHTAHCAGALARCEAAGRGRGQPACYLVSARPTSPSLAPEARATLTCRYMSHSVTAPTCHHPPLPRAPPPFSGPCGACTAPPGRKAAAPPKGTRVSAHSLSVVSRPRRARYQPAAGWPCAPSAPNPSRARTLSTPDHTTSPHAPSSI